MVIDFLVSGKHMNGCEFYAPIRIWGPRRTDLDDRLRQIIELSGEIESWKVEERRVRRLLSVVYRGAGYSKLQFIFYGDDPDSGDAPGVTPEQDSARI